MADDLLNIVNLQGPHSTNQYFQLLSWTDTRDKQLPPLTKINLKLQSILKPILSLKYYLPLGGLLRFSIKIEVAEIYKTWKYISQQIVLQSIQSIIRKIYD